MTELIKLGACEALESLKAKKFSATELIEAHIQQIEKHRNLNAFITETLESAKESAKKSDSNIASGNSRKLEGIPIGIKDLYCTKGIKTTAGSKMLNDFVPTYESTVTQKLIDTGTISLGKLNLDEFAMGSSNLTSYFGPCISPWRGKVNPEESLVPGGSSGGSASAVSAFMCMGATGTDTGGSIRQPAAFTGIVGMKPTYGRCSRWGVIAFASSLDQPGMFARSVKDTALFMEAIMGHDNKDSTSADLAVPNLLSACEKSIRGLKVGVPTDLMSQEGIDQQIINMWQKTIDILKNEGAEIIDISLPNSKYGLPVYYVIAPAEASSNLARYDGVRYGHRTANANNINDFYELTRAEGFGAEVKRRIIIGTYVLSSSAMDAYYIKAQRIRRMISNDFDEAYKKVDAIILPSAPTEAFGVNVKQDNPVNMYLNDIFTIPVSLAGLPGLSLPVSFSENGLPLGMQVIGRRFDEETVIQISSTIEKCVGTKFIPGGF